MNRGISFYGIFLASHLWLHTITYIMSLWHAYELGKQSSIRCARTLVANERKMHQKKPLLSENVFFIVYPKKSLSLFFSYFIREIFCSFQA